MKPTVKSSCTDAELRHRAEQKLGASTKKKKEKNPNVRSIADTQRVLHELQVHQIELEMQNSELQEARDRMETLADKYSDLYDFAPIGYFSLDEHGSILDANLTGAVMLGAERSRLAERRFQRFVAPLSRPDFLAFLQKVFAGPGKQVCEVAILNEDNVAFWVNLQAMPAVSLSGPQKWCRLAVLDITALKRADEAQQRVNALTATNWEMRLEIARRQSVETALKKGEQHQRELLEQSRHLQAQLRSLSHQVLAAQEDERKRISRELHDEIVQALVGINVHLGTLIHVADVNPKALKRTIARTQRLVRNSVNIVHRFARNLRPTMLDDLGFIPALHSYLKEFSKRTKVRVNFTATAEIENLAGDRRTVIYRVAQSALTNIAQHARATQVNVNVEKLKDAMRMEIHDNGKAFDVGKVLFAKRHTRLGLIGMRERVEMIGGSFSVTSSPGKGTTVRADIPFKRAKAAGS